MTHKGLEPAGNIMAFSDHTRDDCWHPGPERIRRALSACWQNGHWRLPAF